jgi:hypothetical protein
MKTAFPNGLAARRIAAAVLLMRHLAARVPLREYVSWRRAYRFTPVLLRGVAAAFNEFRTAVFGAGLDWFQLKARAVCLF